MMAGVVEITTPARYSARFVAWDGSEIAIVAPRPSPPGAPLDGTIDGQTLRLKVNRCRRRAEATEFLVVGRPLDLRRQTRDTLEALAASAADARVVERW